MRKSIILAAAVLSAGCAPIVVADAGYRAVSVGQTIAGALEPGDKISEAEIVAELTEQVGEQYATDILTSNVGDWVYAEATIAGSSIRIAALKGTSGEVLQVICTPGNDKTVVAVGDIKNEISKTILAPQEVTFQFNDRYAVNLKMKPEGYGLNTALWPSKSVLGRAQQDVTKVISATGPSVDMEWRPNGAMKRMC